MPGVQKRLYIGNIPVAATEADIRAVLSKHGNVSSVELKTKVNVSEASNSKTFAYADVEFGSDQQLHKCLGGEWDVRGSQIKIQVAKEHFLARLQRERTGGEEPDQAPHHAPHQSNGYESRQWERNTDWERNRNKNHDNNKKYEPKRFNDGNEIKKKTMFQRLESITPPVPVADEEPVEQVSLTKQQLDDVKRMKSLQLVQQQKEREQQLIRESLRNPAASKSKRIVFDTGDSPSDGHASSQPSVPKTPLFHDDDEDGDDANVSLPVNRSARQSTQLIEMQSQFAHDSRFQVNQSFLPDDDEDDAGGKELEDDEKTRNMDILQSVLKKPLLSRADDPRSKSKDKPFLVPRYDPASADGNKYEIKRKADVLEEDAGGNGEKVKNNKLKKEKDRETSSHAAKPAAVPTTSSERFYSVSQGLREAFASKKTTDGGAAAPADSGFKLSSLFSSAAAGEASQDQSFDLWSGRLNEDSGRKTKAKAKATEKPSAVIASERDLFSEHFFFEDDDKRLDTDPFFDAKLIKRLRFKMAAGKLAAGMQKTLVKKNKAMRNKRQGHVYGGPKSGGQPQKVQRNKSRPTENKMSMSRQAQAANADRPQSASQQRPQQEQHNGKQSKAGDGSKADSPKKKGQKKAFVAFERVRTFGNK